MDSAIAKDGADSSAENSPDMQSRHRKPVRASYVFSIGALLAVTACAGPQMPPTARAPQEGPAQQAMWRGHPSLPRAVVVDGLALRVGQLVPGGLLYSGFGPRSGAGGGGSRYHYGIDISAPDGTPIHAAAGGQVLEVGRAGAYGRLIRIRHSPHVETVYAHLSGYAPAIKPGHVVRAGDLIGFVGTSGRTTGPHLHFEVRRDSQPVDPLAQPAAAADS